MKGADLHAHAIIALLEKSTETLRMLIALKKDKNWDRKQIEALEIKSEAIKYSIHILENDDRPDEEDTETT